MIFIFIGGASASGKTGVSARVLKKLTDASISAQLINMDDYFHERPEAIDPEVYRLTTNFDTPKMLHLDLFAAHLLALSSKKSIVKPLFSFLTNRRVGEETINPSEVIIVEGIFAQYFYKNFVPAELATLSVNVTTDRYLDIVDRRVKRDMASRGRELEVVLKQERQYVGPGFLKFTASSATGSDLSVVNKYKDGAEAQLAALDTVADEIIAELKVIQAGLTAGKEIKRRVMPDVREVVAKSHLMAGTLFNPKKFSGHFSGVFGSFTGTYEREFSEADRDERKVQLK